jgi:hypothetical protein
MTFSMKKREERNSSAPVYKPPEIKIQPMANYNGMLPKLNTNASGRIFDSHVGAGGCHPERKE